MHISTGQYLWSITESLIFMSKCIMVGSYNRFLIMRMDRVAFWIMNDILIETIEMWFVINRDFMNEPKIYHRLMTDIQYLKLSQSLHRMCIHEVKFNSDSWFRHS